MPAVASRHIESILRLVFRITSDKAIMHYAAAAIAVRFTCESHVRSRFAEAILQAYGACRVHPLDP